MSWLITTMRVTYSDYEGDYEVVGVARVTRPPPCTVAAVAGRAASARADWVAAGVVPAVHGRRRW